MPRAVPLTLRRKFESDSDDDVAIVLVTLTHESLDATVRVSSDPTRRFSINPPIFGTTSRGLDYQFVLMSAVVPDQDEAAPSTANIQVELLDYELVRAIRSVTTPASIKIEIVMASAVDIVEFSWTGFYLLKASVDETSATLDLSREISANDPWPAFYMTRLRAPGLFA